MRDLVLRGHAERFLVEPMSLRDEDLRAHEVDAGDFLGHRVLDLDAWVHLDEEPLPVSRIEKELDRAGVRESDSLAMRDRGVAKSWLTRGSSP